MSITSKVERLFNNPDFRDIILDEFIDKGIRQYALLDDVDNEKVRDELKARKILNDFLQYCLEFDSIESIKNK